MPDAHELDGANIQSPSYYLLSAKAACPHCGRDTRVFALAVPAVHRWLHADEDAAVPTWQDAVGPAVLFRIEGLAPAVRQRLRLLAPGYRPARGQSPAASPWLNHCDRCREPLDEDELHGEPEGAFMPTDPAAARAIESKVVHQPLQASAGGYVPDAEWLRHLRLG
jgi:hypothetical protein